MNKWERKQARKDARHAEREEDRRQKEKDKQSRFKKDKWRKLNDGGVAYGNKFKIGRGGLIAFSIVGFVIVFFAVGISLNPPDTGEEPAPCANPFCELIDTITGADEYGVKQAPRPTVPESDQDFLPPPKERTGGNFILPFVNWDELVPRAEARGDDEPVCYSQACERAHADKIVAEEATELAQTPAINDQIFDVKKKMKNSEKQQKTLKEHIRDAIIDEGELDIQVLELKSNVKTSEKEVKSLKRDLRHIEDDWSATDEEVTVVKDAYKKALKSHSDLERELENTINDRNKVTEAMEQNKINLEEEELYFISLGEDLSDLKIQLSQIYRNNQFIAIKLSRTCEIMIENEYPTECPTYRELEKEWDNTIHLVSGEFIDKGYDIERQPSQYKNYWKYYMQLPGWKVITVDPDADMMDRAMLIEIQASHFSYIENMGGRDKTSSFVQAGLLNSTSNQGYYKWEDVKVYDTCRHAIVAPDTEQLIHVVNHFLDSCKGEKPEKKVFVGLAPFPSFDKADSMWYKQMKWFKEQIDKYGQK